MMTETPKIVLHRLRAAERGRPVGEPHPDADVLNAFAEQALSGTEREIVLAHLACCLDCREVLATAMAEIAAPETEVVTAAEVGVEPVQVGGTLVRETLVRKTLRPRFGWMDLRWAALAAGIVMAVLVARPGLDLLSRRENNRPAVASSPATSSTTTSSSSVPTAGVSQPASGTQAMSSEEAKVASASGNSSASLANQEQASAKFGKSAAKSDKTERPRTPSPSDHSDAKNGESSNLVADARGAGHPGANNPSGPIVRAKPATGVESGQSAENPGGQNQAAGAGSGVLSESPRWMIEGGALKRSGDGGRNWQTVLQPGNSLLCYASRGAQMWAGGEAGTLLRSTDGGGNWVPVTVLIDGKAVNSDIENISMQDSGAISLTTADHEVFTSADRGKTWIQN